MIPDVSGFWHQFLSTYWEQRPVAIPEGFTAPPISAEQLFDLLVKAGKDRNGRANILIRVFIAAEAQTPDRARQLLPTEHDVDWRGYDHRIQREAKGADYAIIINNLESLCFELWNWTRSFVRPIFRAQGMNNLGSYYALFLGRYRATPFGVHHDPESVFHFPIIGRKRMRFWEPSYVERHPDLRNATAYDAHLGHSVSLEANQTGMIYWPSGAWHVGESTGEFSASLALSMLCIHPKDPMFTIYLWQMLQQASGREHRPAQGVTNPFDGRDLQATARATPKALSMVARQIREIYDQDQVDRLWMRLVSAYGFHNPPLPGGEPHLGLEDIVHRQHHYELVWKRDAGGTLVLSVNGGLFETRILNEDAIEAIERSDGISVRDLLAHCTAKENGESAAECLRLLRWLIAWRGAIRAEDAAR